MQLKGAFANSTKFHVELLQNAAGRCTANLTKFNFKSLQNVSEMYICNFDKISLTIQRVGACRHRISFRAGTVEWHNIGFPKTRKTKFPTRPIMDNIGEVKPAYPSPRNLIEVVENVSSLTPK